ncbi:PepSY domain-containing protein [Porphyromonas levii]|uniref:Uncharacterized protein n=1 Tax=Porphyromonas levii TaxID=28114 RepID=A0A4Y8WRD0_9PORP|nr:PepSY domain-containing protein [Porphyromonas levii]MBR8763439.1 hypothetical protein [Porphyromonas levii]MBR8765247.1 hypothetical protein [Porphyromonas levii]MBR8802557.1 hypothetical protein [Porphyromonas levii]TFH94693.1 hypothetical protein E4P48_09855 [Porphyromonas levii]TFH95471.1 hypothetical protein E4P47_04465 [Porphyromonas levii]
MKITRLIWKWVLELHRFLGTLLSAFVLMWFLSGMVMLYQHYPRVGDKELPHMTSLPAEITDSITRLPGQVSSLTLAVSNGHPSFRIWSEEGDPLLLDAKTLVEIDGHTTLEEAREKAKVWYPEIKSERVLDHLETFVPLPHFRKDLPIYRFDLADEAGTILHYSSQSGALLQSTTRMERFWAYLGPIPHYLYIWQLRQHRNTWIHAIEWIAGIGALMCLLGIIIGCAMYLKVWRKRHKFASPYTKSKCLKWHHIAGFFFGFFAFTFLLSGALSFGNLPEGLKRKEANPDLIGALYTQPDVVVDSLLKSDLDLLLTTFPEGIKQIEVSRFGTKNIYDVAFSDERKPLMIEGGQALPLHITEEEVMEYVSSHTDSPFTLEVIDKYDANYSRRGKQQNLPAYKVTLQDEDQHLVYINPKTAGIRVSNLSTRGERWIFPKLHNFKMGGILSNNDTVRKALIWILLLGGTVLSGTGVWLGVRYFSRKLRSVRRIKRSQASARCD